MKRFLALLGLLGCSLSASAQVEAKPASDADVEWHRASDFTVDPTDEVVVVDGDPFRLFWIKRTSISPPSLDLVNTAISGSGSIISEEAIVSGWPSISAPDLAARQLFFGGNRSDETDGLTEIYTADPQEPDFTSWVIQDEPVAIADGPVEQVSAQFGYAWYNGEAFDTSATAWANDNGLFVHHGTDPDEPNHEYQGALGGCCAHYPTVDNDIATGQVRLAWYSDAPGADGLWVQAVNAGSGAPEDSPVRLTKAQRAAGELTSSMMESRTPMAGTYSEDHDGELYLAYPVGSPSSDGLAVWRIAPGNVSKIILIERAREVDNVTLAGAYGLWVVWSEMTDSGPVIFGRYASPSPGGEALTSEHFSHAVRVAAPAGTTDIGQLTVGPRGGVAASFTTPEGTAWWYADLDPGLRFTAHPKSFSGRTKVTFNVEATWGPLGEVEVRVGKKTAQTDWDSGDATLTLGPFSRARQLTATATREGFTTARLKLRARP